MTAGSGGDGGMGGEVIEVQILPQDDNWGDNTTAITGNTSVRSESFQVIIFLIYLGKNYFGTFLEKEFWYFFLENIVELYHFIMRRFLFFLL